MRITRQEAIVQELESIGFKQVPARTRKYIVLTRPETKNLYIGSKGAMRYGKTVGDSISIANPAAALAAMKQTYGN